MELKEQEEHEVLEKFIAIQEDRQRIKLIRYAWIAGIFIVILWLITALVSPYIFNGLTDSSAFGQQFGSVEALFSGLSLIGIIVAILLQTFDLREQRKLLAAQIKEFSRSVELQANSESALKMRIDLEMRLFKKRSTLDLYDEWHSVDTRQSRRFVSAWVKQKAKNKELIPTLSDIENLGGDIEDHVFKVIHYFEKWALLSKLDEVDSLLLLRILPSYVQWYETNLIDPLRRADERNQDFVNLLRLIKKYVFVESVHTNAALFPEQPGDKSPPQ